MKNQNVLRLLVWASVIMMPLWFGSCGNGGDDVTPNASAVEGTWRFSGYKVNPGIDFTGTGTGPKTTDFFTYLASQPGGADLVTCFTDSRITFNSNGRVTGTSSNKPQCGDPSMDMNPVEDNSMWKLDGNKLTLTSGTDVTVFDAAINGNLLKMSMPQKIDTNGDGTDENYTFTLELTKV